MSPKRTTTHKIRFTGVGCAVCEQAVQNDRPARPQAEQEPEASYFSPAHPKLPRQLVLQVGYVEDSCELRTTHGRRRVLARQGRAGEKRGFFSILPNSAR